MDKKVENENNNTEYSRLPLRQTHSGPPPTVHLREVPVFEGDKVND